jgi:hypothetical protein
MKKNLLTSHSASGLYDLKRFRFWIFIILLLISACEFQPNEIPEVLVEKPSENGPELLIEVTPNMDTLRIARDVTTQFKLSSTERNAEWIKIYFDDELIIDSEYSETNIPEYFIQHENYSEGNHILKIQAFMSTNSGSIAEKLDAENYFYETQWPVFIKHNVSVKFEHTFFEDGVAWLKWIKYDFWGFEKYIISKKTNLKGNEFEGEIFNSYTNEIIDSSSIEGEIAEYNIVLNENGWRDISQLSVPIIPPNVVLNNNNEIEIGWEKSENQKNWESYFITSKYELNGFVESQRIYNADSTATIFKKIGFGKPYEIQVRYIPKTFTGEYLNYESAGGLTKFNLGEEMPDFEACVTSQNSNLIILYKRIIKDYFYRFNDTNKTLEDSIQIEGFVTDNRFLMLSPNGEYFAYFTHTKFVLRKTSDFSIVSELNLPFLNSGNLGIFSSSISNDLKLFVVDHNYTFKVFNANSGEEIFTKAKSNGNSIYISLINESGTRVLFQESELGKSNFSLYKFENNELELIANAGTYSEASAYLGENKILISYKTDFWTYKIEIRDSNDFSLEKTTSIPYEYRPYIFDIKKMQVISKYDHAGENGYSYLTNLETSNSQKIFPVLGWGPFILKDNFLYGANGRFIQTNKLLIDE